MAGLENEPMTGNRSAQAYNFLSRPDLGLTKPGPA